MPDRDARTLAQWLQNHRGIQILSRDRSVVYKNAMTTGAPQAIQVADRFHLLQDTTHTSPNPYHNFALYQRAGQQHDFTALALIEKVQDVRNPKFW